MSTIKSSDEHLTLNADGTSKDIKLQSNASEKVIIKSDGKVGIGVTPESWDSNTPALQLGKGGSLATHANNPTKVMLSGNFYSNSSGTDSYIETNEASQFFQEEGAFQFRVAPSGTADNAISWTTAMTIENDGDVLVGTASSFVNQTTRLEVLASASGADALGCKVIGGNDRAISFYQTGYSSPRGHITVGTSSVAYNTSSDHRLKENVDYTWDATTRLKQLKPARFNFIEDDTNTLVDGFIAHEVSSVVPEAVSGEKDAMKDEEYEVTPAVKDEDGNIVTEAVMGTRSVPDYQGIDQSKLVPLLVKTIQELEARITALEA